MGTGPESRRHWQWLAVGALLALAVAYGLWQALAPGPRPADSAPAARASAPATAAAGTDPRLTLESPFRNVRPGVDYVGDAVCGRCHGWHVRAFAGHAMGRTLAPVAAATAAEKFDDPALNPFQRQGLEYRVRREGGQVWHEERAVPAPDLSLEGTRLPVAYAVGSATHGRSYLIDRDGFLFMSPITWYPQKGLWDLSPGYAQYNQHFNRPITAECLFCHSQQAFKLPDTLNRYGGARIQGTGIGCEHCHGPGALHVQKYAEGRGEPGFDDTIVNPARLEPRLREAVCQQCHLEGQHRILRRGVDAFDYRPGLPLEAFLTVLVKPPAYNQNNHFVGHVEQMEVSRCFIGSNGRLGCTSCHDPHVEPAPARKVAYFRKRCLNCHADRHPCTEVLPVRQANGDDCAKCHVPAGPADITHTSISDHRILKRPESPELQGKPVRLAPGELPLAFYPGQHVDPKDPERQRDLGLGLMELSDKVPEAAQRVVGAMALPLVAAAARAHPDDLPAVEAHANALWMTGQRPEALAIFEGVLKERPRRETALYAAAAVAMELRRWDLAIGYWERAVQANPYRWRYRAGLAAAHAANEQWNQALFAADQALKLNPVDVDTRQVVARGLLALGKPALARQELERLVALRPQDAKQLRAWFADLERRGR